MAQQKEIRLLTGGIDADSAPHLIKDGALLNAVGTTLSKSGQSKGERNMVAGNAEVSAVATILTGIGGTATLIGWTRDETDGALYLFFYITGSASCIIRYRPGSTAQIMFRDADVTGGLSWNANLFISARVLPTNLLVWTDDTNAIRYINLTTNYSSVGPIEQTELTFITEPPAFPPGSSRTNTASISTSIQAKSIRFAYRFVNDKGMVSVLSPYSLISYATRASAIATSSIAGNTITIALPLEQKIPRDWASVELVALFGEDDGGGAYIIKRWRSSIGADVTAVVNHNTVLTALTFTGWTGVKLELLDTAYTAKLFDSVPVRARLVEAAANRVLLGALTEGYDTPELADAFTITQLSQATTLPTETTAIMYAVVAFKTGGVQQDYPFYGVILVNIGSEVYMLPKEYSLIRFQAGHLDTFSRPSLLKFKDPLWMPPKRVSKSSLIKLQISPLAFGAGASFSDLSTAASSANSSNNGWVSNSVGDLAYFIAQAHGDIDATALDQTLIGIWEYWTQASIANNFHKDGVLVIEDDPSEEITSGVTRCFVPNSEYKWGVNFYDEAMRKCGVKELGSFRIPPYQPHSHTLVKKVSVSVPGTNAGIPLFASTYGIAFSKNQRGIYIDHFQPNLIKVATKDDDGVVRVDSDLYNNYKSLKMYGLAIPISTLNKYKTGVAFKVGDIVRLDILNEGVAANNPGNASFDFELVIKDFLEGYVITELPAHPATTMAGMLSNHVISNSGMSWISSFSINKPVWLFIDNSNVNALNTGCVTSNQSRIYCTIYSATDVSSELYEIGLFGAISGFNTGVPSYATLINSSQVDGDMHSQIRTGTTGGCTGLSIFSNEHVSAFWPTDHGRISLLDHIGQKNRYNAISWGNVHVPGAEINGFSSFEALNTKTVDEMMGTMNGLVLTTRGVQDGGQLLVICQRGSSVALVGQQQLKGADANTNLVIAAEVISDFNPITGNFGCDSPRSIVVYKHHVWWVDVYNRKVIEFNDSGAHAVSEFLTDRLFQQLLTRTVANGQVAKITCGINTFTQELIVSIPESSPLTQTPLTTSQDPLLSYPLGGLENPFDAYVQMPMSFLYHWESNTWTGRYKSGHWFMWSGTNVYAWDQVLRKLWAEFVNINGTSYGSNTVSCLSFVFNGSYPAIKNALGLRLVATRKPDTTWIMYTDQNGAQHVADVSPWVYNRGEWVTAIRKDRTTGAGITAAVWARAGIDGKQLAASVLYVAFLWTGGNNNLGVSSATLIYEVDSAHQGT